MDESIKQKIIELLDDTEKSTTELASLLNRNHYDVVEFLEEMEKEGIIQKIEISKFTFWKNKHGN
jgi:predicted transcriptional regulator